MVVLLFITNCSISALNIPSIIYFYVLYNKSHLLVTSSDHHEEHFDFYISIVYFLYKSQYDFV